MSPPQTSANCVPLRKTSCKCPKQEGGLAAADMCDALLRASAALGKVALMLQAVRAMHALDIPVGYVAHGCVLSALGRAERLEVSPWLLARCSRTGPMW